MEKRTPHCKLAVVRMLLASGKVRSTSTARRDAAKLGFSFADMLNVVMALESADFYKSMTTHDDHKVWQDVYRSATGMPLYIKLTVVDDVLIVSFKEL